MEKTFATMRTKNDECFTCEYNAMNLVEYLFDNKIINKESKIWLPFNDVNSFITKALKNKGCISLITTEQDFYNIDSLDFDIIISNPPFSKRSKLFQHMMRWDKPFILLQPIMFFNNRSCVKMLCEHNNDFGFLCPNERMGFIQNGIEHPWQPSFYSFWLCYKVNLVGFVSLNMI
jgi:hypothetical protein